MASDVQIEQFNLADQQELISFLKIAYPVEPRKSDPTFWKWHYLENPLTSPNDIPLWIVKSGKEIVGQLATIPVELKVGSDTRRAIWILDFVILPEYRRRGLGKRLVLTARESFPLMITLGINEESTAVFRSLNWVALRGLQRFHKLLYPGNAFSEVAGVEPLRRFANLVYAPFRPSKTRLHSDGVEIRTVTTFDASFQELWQRASDQWPCVVVRGPRQLEWQFRLQPGKKFDVLGCYQQDQIVGYVVLFFRSDKATEVPPKVAISDIFYDARASSQVIDELLKAALRLALDRHAGSLVVDVLDPRVEDRLRQFGFWKIKAAPQFMASTSELQDLVYNERNWFLTRGDSDVSIFEEANILR